jgi:outer membrane protein OmpA-like peptidoglycan-associated protein
VAVRHDAHHGKGLFPDGSVRDHLAADGFPTDQASTFGEDETTPVVSSDTEEGCAANRRVVIAAQH